MIGGKKEGNKDRTSRKRGLLCGIKGADRVFLFTTQKNNQDIIKYVDKLDKEVYNIIIKIIKGYATPYQKENK